MDIEDIEDHINDLDWKINNRLDEIKGLKKEKLIYQRLLKAEKELKKYNMPSLSARMRTTLTSNSFVQD